MRPPTPSGPALERWRTFAGTGMAVTWLLLTACAAGAPPKPVKPAPSELRLVHSEPSAFGQIVVAEDGGLRYLCFGGEACGAQDYQSVISIADADATPSSYIRYATIGVAYTPEVKRLLMVGLGGGTFTNLVHRARPDVHIDAVEINPVVVRVASEYFRVRSDARYHLHVADGREFVDGIEEPYDLIFLDAYSAGGLPNHLTTSNWFAAVASKLGPSGVLVLNLSGDARTLVERVQQQLPGLACFRTPATRNLIVVARRDARMPNLTTLGKRAGALDGVWRLPFDMKEIARRLDAGCREALSSSVRDPSPRRP